MVTSIDLLICKLLNSKMVLLNLIDWTSRTNLLVTNQKQSRTFWSVKAIFPQCKFRRANTFLSVYFRQYLQVLTFTLDFKKINRLSVFIQYN